MYPTQTMLPLFMGLLALALALPSWAHEQISRSGNIALHVEAVSTTCLTPEATRQYNVQPDAQRGLLTVTVVRNGGPDKIQGVAAQVYAAAMTQANQLMNIPLREMRENGSVYYLGEFQLQPPDVLRFLVNANLLGHALQSDFSRAFPKE